MFATATITTAILPPPTVQPMSPLALPAVARLVPVLKARPFVQQQGREPVPTTQSLLPMFATATITTAILPPPTVQPMSPLALPAVARLVPVLKARPFVQQQGR